MMNAFKTAVAAATFGIMLALPSVAATVVVDFAAQGGSNNAGIDFAVGYGATTPTGAAWTDDPTWTVPNGNVSGQAQSPFNSNGLTNTQDYFVVGGSSTEGGAPSGTSLVYEAVQDTFNILWGSIDSYNTIVFSLAGDVVDMFTGTDIVNLPDGLTGTGPNFESVALISFSGLSFDTVTFLSTQAAFEFALPAAVPLPAGGLLLIGALGGLAALRRRKAA